MWRAIVRMRESEARAHAASGSFRPQHLTRAAQCATVAGRHQKALVLYGEAIDGYLQAGRSRAAEVLCRQVIAAYPHVVRARRTLALLAIGRGEQTSAVDLLQDYTRAARDHGDPQILRYQLRLIGGLSEAEVIRGHAADELRRLGDPEGAAFIVSEEARTGAGALQPDSGRWSQALHAALLSPTRLREDTSLTF